MYHSKAFSAANATAALALTKIARSDNHTSFFAVRREDPNIGAVDVDR